MCMYSVEAVANVMRRPFNMDSTRAKEFGVIVKVAVQSFRCSAYLRFFQENKILPAMAMLLQDCQLGLVVGVVVQLLSSSAYQLIDAFDLGLVVTGNSLVQTVMNPTSKGIMQVWRHNNSHIKVSDH
ncbi:uncharacterized protein LOC141670456 isoform X2 [Apium graveolens]|uniref:uncharacterized protein LOC141670456 isoform X2 n=2 Tax=Apium graveolens TaxID=4045 RepID=UPI003D791C05